jgi:putative FmdB family regulatory protein
MPFYEYECQACGKHTESLQKISDPPLLDCPACGKPALQKQMSASGFRLTGAGWYATDFKDKGKNKGTDKGKEAAADGKAETPKAEAVKTDSPPAKTKTFKSESE